MVIWSSVCRIKRAQLYLTDTKLDVFKTIWKYETKHHLYSKIKIFNKNKFGFKRFTAHFRSNIFVSKSIFGCFSSQNEGVWAQAHAIQSSWLYEFLQNTKKNRAKWLPKSSWIFEQLALKAESVHMQCDLPPVCRALDSISLHLRRTESDVPGARGNADMWVLGIVSTASLLLLELLLELERIKVQEERRGSELRTPKTGA